MDERRRKQIDKFFEDVIYPEEFARDTRRFLYESMKMALTPPELRYMPDPSWVNNGINALNMFCEVLHPVLDEEFDEDKDVNEYINP